MTVTWQTDERLVVAVAWLVGCLVAWLVGWLNEPLGHNPCHPNDRDLADPLQTGERLAVAIAIGWLVTK